jgi:hypothetical protein
MVKCSYYDFLLKECKGMHKMMQLNSNMLPFMQLHVHYVNLMKKKTRKFQSLEISNKRPPREMIPLLDKLATFFYIH